MKKVFIKNYLEKILPFSIVLLMTFIIIFQGGCKKNADKSNGTGNTISSDQLVVSIANSLSANDSLQQFVQLFKTLSLSDADVSEGITVLAVSDNALMNPVNSKDLKDYIIKGVVTAADFTDGKVFTSITGKSITITVQNGKVYANGTMISVSPAASAAHYSVYASAGLFISGPAAYNDPHKSEYYLEYYENGNYRSLSGGYITTWPFIESQNFPTPASGAGNLCSYPSFNSYSGGPSLATVIFEADIPFMLQINRTNLLSIPVPGDYKISEATYNSSQNRNTGNCNLIINGATFGCGFGRNDAYVHVNITDVKVDQDLGVEKRGYYKGTFDAILYYTPHNSSSVEKRVITGGRFMAPMGGNQTCPINGTAPAIDRYKVLTTGKWYLRPTVETWSEPNDACNLDDYIVFGTDGVMSIIDGGVKCKNDEGDIEYGSISWTFKDNQTIIVIGGAGGEEWTITELSETRMVLNGMILTHGD